MKYTKPLQMMAAAAFLPCALMAGCTTVGNVIGLGDGPVSVSQVGAANACRGEIKRDALQVLANPSEVGHYELQHDFRLQFPAPLSDGPFLLVEIAASTDGASSFAVSRSARVYHGTLYVTATWFPANTSSSANPCVLLALPPGRYQRIVLQSPSGVRHAVARVSFHGAAD